MVNTINNKHKIRNSEWKEIIEQNLIEIYSEKLYNMSLYELQKEADSVDFDISQLFLKKT